MPELTLEYATQANLHLQNVMQRLVPIIWRLHKNGFPIGSTDLENNVMAFKANAWQKRIADLKQSLFAKVGREYNFDNHHPTSKNGVRHFLYGKKAEGGLELEPVKLHGKIVSDKFAVCKLHYLNQKNEEINSIFRTMIEMRLLTHRYRFATARLLLFDACKRCDKDTKYKCLYCGGTGHGRVLGFDPRYCTERNGWVYVHPYYLQNQITLRVGCADPNLEQVPRNNDEYQIDVRDQYCAEPENTFVFVDGAKTERLFAAVRFGDPVMYDEAVRGHPAVAEFGAEIFGVPAESITKNSPLYAVLKTLVYATQLGGKGETVHTKFMESYRYYEIDYCQELVEKCEKRYEVYYHNAKEEGWKALKDGFWVTYHGQRFLTTMPYELLGYSHYSRIRNPRAIATWERHLRFFMASQIQGPATGFHIQIAALRAADEIDKLVNPVWSDDRMDNGNSEIACLAGLKHDELIAKCKKPMADEIEKILVKHITNLEDCSPYLPTTMLPQLKFGLKFESECLPQWSIKQDKDWKNMSRDKNPLHFYNEHGHRFRA